MATRRTHNNTQSNIGRSTMVTISKASVNSSELGPARKQRSRFSKSLVFVLVVVALMAAAIIWKHYSSLPPPTANELPSDQLQEQMNEPPSGQSQEEMQEVITPRTVPDEWWEYKTWEISELLDCESIYDAGRPIHSHEDWVSLRKAYRNVVGEKSSIRPTDDMDGFGNVAIEAKIAPGKGRGVFAAQDIKKDTLVWTARHQSAQFDDGHSFREFLAAIPPDMACDVLMWAYVHDIGTEEEPNLKINCDLDEGSFMNSASYVDGTDEDTKNVASSEELQEAMGLSGAWHEFLFATRDIKAGEEILCSYGDFALPKGWRKFGLH